MREKEEMEPLIVYSRLTDRQLIDLWFEASNVKFEIDRGGNVLMCRGIFYLDVLDGTAYELWARGTVANITNKKVQNDN